MKIKYDMNLMQSMSIFEKITRAKLKDCFELSCLVFVVQEQQIGKAIGKNASNVKKLENILNRKIKIVEFNPQLLEFVKKVIYPLKLKDIEESDKVVKLTPADSKTRGILIGRNAQNLRETESIVKRFFDIQEIKVI